MSWQPPMLPVSDGRVFPVRHAWCVGRNYVEHAREMGVDPERSAPVFFSKPARALVHADQVQYPPDTGELHHEVELVVFLADGGRDLSPEQVKAAIFGYAVGVDLTRRDVQARAKAAGQPWEMSKGFDQSGPAGMIVPAGSWQPNPESAIGLSVDGDQRQSAELGQMIWTVPELLAQLSRTVTLAAGDAVFTGTPAGVSALYPGQHVRAHIEGLPELAFELVAA
ncbi:MULTISPECIES: fumarylacetoacetate hydrolase family protein [unclassified Wenzhouxiangella]|uniref:fumarylacetoacetate hydrolase family protein n=1 Tax=unclassified Wenzhouxiangella TaxID=2613841 RepID=UPI001C6EB90C|nr:MULTISPECIES: fumarylacetoacetate hydrolase family protein [unclassified Wenzhouxiangella]